MDKARISKYINWSTEPDWDFSMQMIIMIHYTCKLLHSSRDKQCSVLACLPSRLSISQYLGELRHCYLLLGGRHHTNLSGEVFNQLGLKLLVAAASRGYYHELSNMLVRTAGHQTQSRARGKLTLRWRGNYWCKAGPAVVFCCNLYLIGQLQGSDERLSCS